MWLNPTVVNYIQEMRFYFAHVFVQIMNSSRNFKETHTLIVKIETLKCYILELKNKTRSDNYFSQKLKLKVYSLLKNKISHCKMLAIGICEPQGIIWIMHN